MTADKIERTVEHLMNSLDAQLMSRCISQAEYDRKVRAADRWADMQYRRIGRAA